MHDPLGEKLLTRLRLKFSHLKEHKFRHGFADTINPMCACGVDVQTMEHFLLRCHFYSTQRLELFDNLERANPDFKNLSDKDQASFMLYGSKTNTSENFNQNIIKIIIMYLKKLVVLKIRYFKTNEACVFIFDLIFSRIFVNLICTYSLL